MKFINTLNEGEKIMLEDAKKLLQYIRDYTDGNREKELIFDAADVVEIVDVERKCKSLLENLKQEKYIQYYRIEKNEGKHTIAVKLTAKDVQPPIIDPIISVDKIHEDVMEKFIKESVKGLNIGSEEFSSYSELFSYFVKIKKDDSEVQKVDDIFEFIVDQVQKTDGENYIKILGPDGTGKSTFLSLLYLYLYESYCDHRLQEYPYYINLHYYDREITQIDSQKELDAAIKKQMNEDLSDLLKLSEENENNSFLIIIDGNEKYYRTHLKSSTTLQKILKKMKGHKKIICLGEKTNIHYFREKTVNEFIDSATSYTYYFSPIYINEREKWKDIIKTFCGILNCTKEVTKICDCIDRFNIKEIDYNLLSIFGKVSENWDLSKISSISSLYKKYCLDYLDNSEINNENSLKESIHLSYRYFMTEEFIPQMQISANWKEWELVHQHKAISNYLLALHYSNLIFEGKDENFTQFQCVFTNGINIFLKSIINENYDKKIKTIKFCNILFDKGDFRAKSQAAYLLGRIKDNNLENDARKILNNQLIICATEKNIKEKEQKRQNYFVKRSILVSLLHLEDSSAGDTLLKDLIDFPLMNEVNRGFYLQYYDDVPQSQPEVVNLEDKGKNKITYTSSVLFNYVNAQFEINKNDWSDAMCYNFQIHLFTLCSLIQIRLDDRQYSVEREELSVILERAIDELENKLEDKMLVYMSMLLDDIKHKVNNIGHLYHELYALKDVQRKGWVTKIKADSIDVDKFENVVEHTYFAWLLGMLYLPEKKPFGKRYSKYDKRKILNCLLIHDLAEAYLGDHLPEETTGQVKDEEKECMRKIFMHSLYPGIANMNSFKETWEKFDLKSDDINGEIAKELDIIQAIYQFCIYKRKGATFEKSKEKEWRREKNKIKTSLGQKILKEVVLNNFSDILE